MPTSTPPEGEDAPRPKRAETFAERKKRLAEEKAAREAAEAAAAAVADEDVPAPDDSDAATGEDAPAQPAPDAADDSQPTKPSLTDLYAMRPSSQSRSAGSVGENPVASREASEAPEGAERRADGVLPGAAGASDDAEKEA